jgi:hypothetical protein
VFEILAFIFVNSVQQKKSLNGLFFKLIVFINFSNLVATKMGNISQHLLDLSLDDNILYARLSK